MSKDIRPTKSQWIKLGEELSERIRKRTKEGKGATGNFKQYTSKYKSRKVAGKFKRQSSNSGTPDLQLSGDMLRDLQVRGANRESVKIGWTGSFAERVQHNADMGREITTKKDPISKDLQNYATKQVRRMFGKGIDKVYNKTQTIKVKM